MREMKSQLDALLLQIKHETMNGPNDTQCAFVLLVNFGLLTRVGHAQRSEMVLSVCRLWSTYF